MNYDNFEDRLIRIEKIQENINNQLELFSSLINLKVEGKEIDSLIKGAKLDYNRILVLNHLIKFGLDNVDIKDDIITELIGSIPKNINSRIFPYNNWKNYFLMGKEVYLKTWIKRHFTLSNIILLNRDDLLKNVRMPEYEINDCIYTDHTFMLMYNALPNWRDVYNLGKHKYKLKEKVDAELNKIKAFTINLNGECYEYFAYDGLIKKHDFQIFNLYDN